MEQIRERRSFPRFLVKDLTLAINQTVFGPVVDISLGGMAFEYYSDDFKKTNHSKIGIYHMTSGFLISDVECKIIRDNVIEHREGIMPIIRKRCAVQFHQTSNEQEVQLKSFIEQHAIKKD